MRTVLITCLALVLVPLASCGGPQDSQSTNPRQPLRIHPTLDTPELGITPIRAKLLDTAIAGKLVTGDDEDLVLVGEVSKYVFERNRPTDDQKTAHDTRFMPGALIDADGSRGGTDGLISINPGISLVSGTFLPINFDQVKVHQVESDGALIATGNFADANSKLEITHRAVLGQTQPHIILTTTIANKGTKAVNLRMGDRLRFGPGSVNTDLQGPRTRPGDTKAYLLSHESLPQGYGYTIDGKSRFTASFHTSQRGNRTVSLAIDTLNRPTKIAPGKETKFVRRFLASGQGLPGVYAWADQLLNKSTGTIRGELKTSDTKIDPKQFRLAVYKGKTFVGHLPVRSSLGIDCAIPTGRYRVETIGPWGLKAPPKVIDVLPNKTVRFDTNLPRLGIVDIQITDKTTNAPLPATAIIKNANGKKVWLGDGSNALAAGPYAHLISGRGQIKLAAGKYTILATRGPEYDLATADITIPTEPDDVPIEVDLAIERKLPSQGYIIADLRMHSNNGSQSVIPLGDLGAAIAASGIEFAVVADAQDALTPTNALPVRAVMGVTAEPIMPTLGHFNAFPANIDPTLKSPIPRRGTSPEFLTTKIAALSTPKPLITLVWPRTISRNGYFDRYQLDQETGSFTAPDATTAFDAIELFSGGALSGSYEESILDGLLDWQALFKQDINPTVVASSGTTRLGIEPVALPFTWVHIGDRDKLTGDPNVRLEPKIVLDGLRTGNTVLSTGPLVKFTVQGKPPGSLIRGRGRLRAEVEVISTAWVNFERVQILAGNEPVVTWEADDIEQRDDGLNVLKQTTTLTTAEDTAYTVLVTSSTPLPTTPHLSIRPFALTGAVRVDANGNGFGR